MLISLLFSNPILFFIVISALILSLSVHEAAHAFASYKLGDPTAKSMGRLTLNPLSHVDPIGFLLLITVGFGWGRPVPFDPSYFKNPKRDTALVALAGPLSNFLLALLFTAVFSIIVHAFAKSLSTEFFIILFSIFKLLIYYNVVLGIFNLIPIHPLDGFKIVSGLLSGNLYYQWMDTARFGSYILLILILTDTTSKFIFPVVDVVMRFLHFS